MRLELVTLAFNNPLQVKRTLASVALQLSKPDRHIVLDGSSAQFAASIEKLSSAANAEYLWREPQGIYPAMNDALDVISPDAYVWFINSSDWLASPESVRIVRESCQSGDVWLVGGLHRYRDIAAPFHPLPIEPQQFVQFLKQGRTGFAHPSSIMRRSAIEECGGFDTRYEIAADYALALDMATSFGAPRIIDFAISVHDPTGLTSRHRVRHFCEKSRARVRNGASTFAEWRNLLQAALFVGYPVSLGGGDLGGQRQAAQFSQKESGLGWPEDCVAHLNSWLS